MKSTIAALTFIAACLTVSTATARTAPLQECQSSAECPESYACIMDSIQACPDCISDEECPPCETHSFGYCEPPPPEQCASDADCTGDNVCVSYTYAWCSGSGGGSTCTGDEPCGRPEPEPEECGEVTEAYCVPPYYAPCQIDSDCGNGFTCEDLQVCSCSGSRPSEDGDQEIPEPDCQCAPTGDKYCELIYVACEDNSDCAAGLECFDGYSGGVITDPAPPGETEPFDPDGGDLLPHPEESSFCAPPGYWGSPSTTGGFDSPAGDAQGAERLSWGKSGPGSASGTKAGGGCTTAEGNASLGIFGLFALIALRLRR